MAVKVHMVIVRGSPCVVPSMDSKTSPQMNNLAGSLYVLVSVEKIAGQFMDIFLNAT